MASSESAYIIGHFFLFCVETLLKITNTQTSLSSPLSFTSKADGQKVEQSLGLNLIKMFETTNNKNKK